MEQYLNELRERAKEYEQILKTQMLENCNNIVQVGAMTLTTNELRQVVPQLAKYPTQFADESIEIIMGMTFYNGKEEVVIPKVFKSKEWYAQRLKEINDVIQQIQEM